MDTTMTMSTITITTMDSTMPDDFDVSFNDTLYFNVNTTEATIDVYEISKQLCICRERYCDSNESVLVWSADEGDLQEYLTSCGYY